MNEILEGKGLVDVAEDKVYVTDIKGPLEDGWREKVDAFAARICDEGRAPARGSTWSVVRGPRGLSSAGTEIVAGSMRGCG
jgi:hypothetical protein